MTIIEFYEFISGDFNAARRRIPSDALLIKFAKMFPSDPSMKNLREAIASGEMRAAFNAAHTLKGVSANLAFTKLHDAASNLTEQLRSGNQPANAGLVDLLETEYKKTIDAIGCLQ